jgi:hypothetical protein
MPEIDVHAHSSADPERVYALLADAHSWTEWSPIEEVVSVEGEGVGQIRRHRSGRVTGVDRVTDLEPGARYGYDFLEGLPVRDYHGDVTLAAAPAGGTDIRWRSTFAPKYPGTGWLMKRGLTRFLTDCAEGLARGAERSSGAAAG